MTRGAMRTVEFKVMDIATSTEEEAEYCYINEDTEILYEGEALKVSPRHHITPHHNHSTSHTTQHHITSNRTAPRHCGACLRVIPDDPRPKKIHFVTLKHES